MSGPTTALLNADPGLVLISAAAIAAANALANAYEEADIMRGEHAIARDATQARLRTAAQQGAAQLAQSLTTAETRLDQLFALAGQLGLPQANHTPRPNRPSTEEQDKLVAYLSVLETLADTLENILLTEAAQRKEALSELAPGFALPAHLLAQPAEQLSVGQRLLARIAHLGELPPQITALANELATTAPGERAELLASELRQQIQIHAAHTQQAQLDAAKAQIIEHTLKELGYQVEEIEATLFVEGGVVHFRKRDWGNYMVRMRVAAAANTANFNVIRAVEAEENERSVQDHIAEDRWCAEFPALLKALAARGLGLEVTRRLEAGELPVQLVPRERLPQFAETESTHRTVQPIARELK